MEYVLAHDSPIGSARSIAKSSVTDVAWFWRIELSDDRRMTSKKIRRQSHEAREDVPGADVDLVGQHRSDHDNREQRIEQLQEDRSDSLTRLERRALSVRPTFAHE
jgi:hypothetical protein